MNEATMAAGDREAHGAADAAVVATITRWLARQVPGNDHCHQAGVQLAAQYALGRAAREAQAPAAVSVTGDPAAAALATSVSPLLPAQVDDACGPALVEGFRLGYCAIVTGRSEEHTSELQSRRDLVCRLL